MYGVALFVCVKVFLLHVFWTRVPLLYVIGDRKFDDTSSVDQQLQVFRDFDFLDIELQYLEVTSNVTCAVINSCLMVLKTI